jgi:hypothetical protein
MDPERRELQMLNVTHDKIDDIPEQYRDLYTEQDGKFVLTGVGGVKTQADVDRVMTGLTKEREDHKATKEKLHAWDGFDNPDELRQKLDKIPELEVMAKGNKEEFESKLEELTEARIGSRLAPVERDNKNLKAKVEELTTLVGTLQAEKTQRQIGDKVGEACASAKVLQEAMPDVKLLANAVFEVTEDGSVLTKENPFGITPGLASDVWLSEMQEKRPHWWPRSTGGGAAGSGGPGGMKGNPWSHDSWNLTEQGKYIKEHGIEKAEQMAKTAGTSVGGRKPEQKKS